MTKIADCLVGLQWGSEGKGKVAAYLAKEYAAMIRSGGPQAGHTFYYQEQKYVHRQIPCGVFADCALYITSAALINLAVLQEEIERYSLLPSKLLIDAKAMVVTPEHIRMEEESWLKQGVASTCEGVGAAQAEKIWRRGVLFKDSVGGSVLERYCADIVPKVHGHLQKKEPILIEGTQGFGLCLNHGHYPFVTSRDVTAAALLNEAGIPPQHHGKTIGVMRTYPIRVGGNSGPTLSEEISWEEIERRSGSSRPILEYTTVTGRLRRVFEQDFINLERALLVNKPTELALMFLDYINEEDHGKTAYTGLSPQSKEYIGMLEERLKTPITLIGTGPREEQIIDRRDKVIFD